MKFDYNLFDADYPGKLEYVDSVVYGLCNIGCSFTITDLILWGGSRYGLNTYHY